MSELERLLVDLKESVERDMQSLSFDMNRGFKQLNVRFSGQASRLDRHAALLQTGSRWTARMNDWAERVDAALEEKDRQFRELAERIKRLEAGRDPLSER